MTSLKAPREIQHSFSQPIKVLYETYRQSTDQYLQLCLSVHSNLLCLYDLGVGAVENFPFKDWLLNPFDAFTPNELEWLRDLANVNSLSIPIEPAVRFLLPFSQKDMDDVVFNSDNSSNLIGIQEVICREQCCFIFGKPGTGKTVLARWITFMNAQAFIGVLKNGSSTEANAVRLPILVHLIQIAQILQLHSDWTLLDCLCCLVQFGKEITISDVDQKAFVRDYICQQHAIIILDGLDEIIDMNEQHQIIKLIYQFILTYIPNGNNKSSRVNGNQLFITSCWYVGCTNNRLAEIPCYILKTLSFDDATSFIDRWFRQIAKQLPEPSINSSLTAEDIAVNSWYCKAKELIKTLSVETELQQLTSNSSLLAAICSLVTVRTLVNPASLPIKRVVFYHFTSALLLHRAWRKFSYYNTVTEREFELFLTSIAASIHQNSSVGLIEFFSIRGVCYSSLKMTPKQNSRWRQQIVNDFAYKTNMNTIGVLVPCGPNHCGFLFPAFQRYLTGFSIMQTLTANNDDEESNIESIVNRVSYHITDPRYREVLLLSLSYISWQWTSAETEHFYEKLLSIDSIRFNRQLPLATMLLMTALPELHSLPPIQIIYTAFNQFMTTSTTQGWLTRFPFFIEHFIKSFDNLPPTDAALWLTNYLTDNSDKNNVYAVVHVLLRLIHQTRQIPLYLRAHQETNMLITVLQSQLDNVFVIDRLLVAMSIFNCEILPNNSMRQYLLESNVQIEQIFPTVLATIIALYGGLQCLSENVIFSPLHMHRTSTLANLLINCLNGNQCNFVNLLDERECEDISSDTVDLFVMWLCMEGIGQPWIYEKYMIWPAFSQALVKLRCVALYLNEYYCTRTNVSCVNDQYTLSSSLFHEAKQTCDRTTSTKLDLITFVQATISAMCRLMFPAGEQSLFLCENVSKLGVMLNLPMLEEYSLRTCSRRIIDFVQLVSPPFLPNHLHTNMDDLAEREQVQCETHPMVHYRHHSSFLLAVLPRSFQPLFACLFDSSSSVESVNNHFQLPFVCLLGEVIRTLSRRREGGARYYLLLAILRAHFEEHQLTNCFTGLIYTMPLSELRSFFVPFDLYLSEQDHRVPFNLLLNEEQQDDSLLYTIQGVQHKHNEGAADNLKLYTSVISLAALVAAIDQRQKDKRQSIVKDDEAIKTALLIDDPILRLHAITVIWQFEQIQPEYVPEIVLNCVSLAVDNTQTPLICHVLLFLIFWSTFASMVALEKSKHQLDQLLDRLESRTNSLSAEIEQAVCETLVHALDHNEFSSLRPRIYQFIKGSEWSKEPNIVSKVLGFHSSSLIDCMQQTSSTVTFLASMYLMQLSIDANTLPMWFRQETTIMDKHDDFNNIQKRILRLFDTSNQSDILTLEGARSIDQLLKENETKATINFSLLEQKLARCCSVQLSTLPIIAGWCYYKTHSYFRKFAYYASLLTLQHYPTSAAMEICCDLLQNDDDDLRQRAYETLTTIYQSSTRIGVHGLVGLLKLTLPSRRYHSAFVYETIASINLRVDSIETLEFILRWERQSVISLLQSVNVRLLIPDVKNQFFIHACTECRKMSFMLDEVQKSDEQKKYQQELYLVELVLYASRCWCIISPEKMSAEENLFIDGLIELLGKQHFQNLTILSKMIVKALIVNRSDPPYIPHSTSNAARQCIKNILKKVVEGINDHESSFSEDAVSTMIKHYYHDDLRFSVNTEEDLELLANLLSCKSFSATITDAAACCFVRYHCFLSNFNPNLCDLCQIFSGSHLRLYRTLMVLPDDSVTSATIRLITSELIKEYADELFPLFIEELCGIVTMFNAELTISQSFNNSNHFKIAVSVIDKMSPVRFRELVQQRMDESVFKRGLYCTSKQLDSKRRLTCLQIITSLYGELTVEVNDMFYCTMWEKASDRQLACACIPNIRQVANRSVAEQLFSQLMTNGSRQRRYLAGMLLVQLARCDELSIFEVQRKLTEAINSPLTILDNNNIDLMQENGSQIPYERLDQALLNLLLQLSFFSNRVSNQTLTNDDYRVPNIINFDEEFSRLIDVDCYASCIVRPFPSV